MGKQPSKTKTFLLGLVQRVGWYWMTEPTAGVVTTLAASTALLIGTVIAALVNAPLWIRLLAIGGTVLMGMAITRLLAPHLFAMVQRWRLPIGVTIQAFGFRRRQAVPSHVLVLRLVGVHITNRSKEQTNLKVLARFGPFKYEAEGAERVILEPGQDRRLDLDFNLGLVEFAEPTFRTGPLLVLELTDCISERRRTYPIPGLSIRSLPALTQEAEQAGAISPTPPLEPPGLLPKSQAAFHGEGVKDEVLALVRTIGSADVYEAPGNLWLIGFHYPHKEPPPMAVRRLKEVLGWREATDSEVGVILREQARSKKQKPADS